MPKRGPERGLAQAQHRLLADVVERVGEADRGRGLALARRRRRDRRHQDQLAVLLVLERLDVVHRHLGLVVAVGLEVLRRDAELFLGDVERSAASWRPARFRCRISGSDAARRACVLIRSGVNADEARSDSVRQRQPNLAPGREVGALRPFAGVDLLAVVGLHARDLEAAVGADDREAVGFDRDDLAELAGDALRVLAPAAAWRRRSSASRRRASSRRRAPDCSRGSGGRSAPTACPSRSGRCRGRSGLRRWPCASSCLMRGALPAFTRSTPSSIASTPIGNRRSK